MTESILNDKEKKKLRRAAEESQDKILDEELGFPEEVEEEAEKEEADIVEGGWEEVPLPGLNIWIPKETGEKLYGTVSEMRQGRYGLEAVISVDGAHEPVITPAHKLLQARLGRVQEGDLVEITYLGETKTGSGRNAKNYVVMRRRRV
jgi:hypothetical protein